MRAFLALYLAACTVLKTPDDLARLVREIAEDNAAVGAAYIEPSIYLDALVQDFLLFGGRIVIRKFDTPRDLMSVSEPVIINCTGLGSQILFGDQELIPLKGQLTHFVPQSEINYQTTTDVRNPGLRGSIGIHMMPRSDGIALGGTSERGVWTLEPNDEARTEIVNQHIQLFTAMRKKEGQVT